LGGRRVKESGSLGTWRRLANARRTTGKGGIYGYHPSLTHLDEGDLKFHTDFRSVYATLLKNQLGFAAEPVLGAKFPTLKFVKHAMTTVLVVDDNPLDRTLVGNSIELAGWSAEYADNGCDALEKIERQRPDLVLTDLQMPEMDGLQLVHEMKHRFPDVPVVLITAYGSEELAVTALKAGASSYVPKRNLTRDLRPALGVVIEASAARRERLHLMEFMTSAHATFSLKYDPAGTRPLVNYCQDAMQMMNLARPADFVRIGTALSEALRNAIDHGNLELSSSMREADDGSYESLRQQRKEEPPYRDRRVHVEMFVSRTEAKFVIRDEGPGFDPSTLPDPTDPENLLRPCGRGVMLMRTFMNEVTFNDRGNEVTLIWRRKE
jgi:CheY-like chemotaxis protein/anti-sigma regulatory factor (Ser/Thr protein kinase)